MLYLSRHKDGTLCMQVDPSFNRSLEKQRQQNKDNSQKCILPKVHPSLSKQQDDWHAKNTDVVDRVTHILVDHLSSYQLDDIVVKVNVHGLRKDVARFMFKTREQ